jgi:hypothetical protein
MHWYFRDGRTSKGKAHKIARKIDRLQARINRTQARIARMHESLASGGYRTSRVYGWPGIRILRGLYWAGLWIAGKHDSWFRDHDERPSQWISPSTLPAVGGKLPEVRNRSFWTFGRRTRQA